MELSADVRGLSHIHNVKMAFSVQGYVTPACPVV